MIDATAASPTAAWADRRALRRHLDLDAMTIMKGGDFGE